MDKQLILKTLKVLRENAPKRNFKQSIDLVINLKDIDLKKQESKVDIYVQLHYDRGRKVKLCGLVGGELMPTAKANLDAAILSDDFSKYAGDKKKLKKLAAEYQFFISQANIMPQVAQVFGKVLGTRGKMPNPKAGCVVPPNANLAALSEKLRKTARVRIDASPVFQTAVGTEEMKDEEIADNVLTIYNALIHALPSEVHNIKELYLKQTMSKAFKIQEQNKDEAKAKKKSLKAGSPKLEA